MVARVWLLALLACSSTKKRVADDATAARADSPPPADAVATTDAPPAPTSAATGDLQIRVEWKDVPVAMRASPGRTACKTPRAPVVAPTTTWGIPDVLLVIEGATLPATTPRIVLADCALSPRIVTGSAVTIESAVDRPAKVTLAKRGELAALDTLATPTTRTILLPIAGHAVNPTLDANGLYELAIDGETAWIAAAPNAGVTEANGQLTIRDLAPGTYAVTAWLPPRAGGAAKLVKGSAKVVAGDLAELVLELK